MQTCTHQHIEQRKDIREFNLSISTSSFSCSSFSDLKSSEAKRKSPNVLVSAVNVRDRPEDHLVALDYS